MMASWCTNQIVWLYKYCTFTALIFHFLLFYTNELNSIGHASPSSGSSDAYVAKLNRLKMERNARIRAGLSDVPPGGLDMSYKAIDFKNAIYEKREEYLMLYKQNECTTGLRIWNLSHLFVFLLKFVISLKQILHLRKCHPATFQQFRVEQKRVDRM